MDAATPTCPHHRFYSSQGSLEVTTLPVPVPTLCLGQCWTDSRSREPNASENLGASWQQLWGTELKAFHSSYLNPLIVPTAQSLRTET